MVKPLVNIGLVYRVKPLPRIFTGTLLANGALVANTAATFSPAIPGGMAVWLNGVPLIASGNWSSTSTACMEIETELGYSPSNGALLPFHKTGKSGYTTLMAVRNIAG